MSSPKRIQLKRTKGWRKPPGAVVVARPGKWGNPYRVVRAVGGIFDGKWVVKRGDSAASGGFDNRMAAIEKAVALHRKEVAKMWPSDFKALRGRDLACWCPLDQPCHADVLLEVANR